MDKQQGLSLVELMVGLLLASLLSLMAFSLLWQQQSAWREQMALQQLQEDGQLVLRVFQDEITQAGIGVPTPLLAVDNPRAREGNLNEDNSVLTFTSQDVTDCLGRTLETMEVVINQYYVRANSEGIPALYCRAFARGTWEEAELVRGVEHFQAVVLAKSVEEGSYGVYAPERLPDSMQALAVSLLFILKHPDTKPRYPMAFSYMDMFGLVHHLPEEGIYQRFFLHRSLFNG